MVGEISYGIRTMLTSIVAMRLIGCLEKLLGQSSSMLYGQSFALRARRLMGHFRWTE